jgi:L-seryl-tRNA(Ser) seleniumtransferase
MAQSDVDTGQRLRELPSVDEVLRSLANTPLAPLPHWALVAAIRAEIDDLRRDIKAGSPSPTIVEIDPLKRRVEQLMRPSLRPVINATGVVLHTNLGRAPLAESALKFATDLARGYCNLEYELDQRKRGSRHDHIRALLAELTGAEDAVVVNNNAAAVLIALAALAKDKEVIVSRGELIEIGGSFRIPDVMVSSGATLREVGTTNRTHRRDYEDAISDETGLLLKVHPSNYVLSGFTAEVAMAELVSLGKERGIPTMFDLGSGTLLDLGEYGLPREPTVSVVVQAGFDLVTFSGDKLLGGPQAGIIVGSRARVEQIRRHPLMRALRPDKLTLGALEGTLRLYRDQNMLKTVPTLSMLSAKEDDLRQLADEAVETLARRITEGWSVEVTAVESRPGGGSLPEATLPSAAISLSNTQLSLEAIEARLRASDPPIIGRIEEDRFILDLRTVGRSQLRALIDGVVASTAEGGSDEKAG